MRKLIPSEIKVLERLIFPESYDVILEETGLPAGALRDDLINLMNYRLIEVVNIDMAHEPTSSFYDADNLQDFTFRATKTVLKQIRTTAWILR